MPMTFEDQTLAANESLKGFENPDGLAKAYLDLSTKVSSQSIDLLPEDMRKDSSITPFKTLGDLVKGYVETKKMVGGIDRAPAKPEEYKFTPLQNLHPRVKLEGVQAALRPMLHAAGAGLKTADMIQQGLAQFLHQSFTKQDEDSKKSQLENETALRAEWKDKYDENLDRVTKIMARLGGPEMLTQADALKEVFKGKPQLLKAQYKLISLLSEDSIKSLGESETRQPADKEQAQKRLNEMIADPSIRTAILDEKNDKHKAMKEEWDNLQLLLAK